jgi:hypothetical protein
MVMRKRRRRPGTVNPRSLTKDRDLSIHPLLRTQKETKDWQQETQQQGVYKFPSPVQVLRKLGLNLRHTVIGRGIK